MSHHDIAWLALVAMHVRLRFLKHFISSILNKLGLRYHI